MSLVQLFHNPGAGDEEHSKKNLMRTIEAQGFECRYSSTKKKGWEKLEAEADFIVLAGGDGTVRKVASELLNRKLLEKKYPIALLPLGTANNVARTLGLNGSAEKLSESWWKAETKSFDIGILHGLDEPGFFLESFGYGLFPRLMKEMKKREEELEEEGLSPEEELQLVIEILHDLVHEYEPKKYTLEIDGVDHSGEYLLVEVMNTRSIGPNLELAPASDPGDGYLEVVMIDETQRASLLNYLRKKRKGSKDPFACPTHKAKKVVISCEGVHAHMDDEYLKLKKSQEVKIEIQKGVLDFIIP
jgi:diacylglycerol kinase (ATP)